MTTYSGLLPLTIAICSNRPDLLATAIPAACALADPADHILVIADGGGILHANVAAIAAHRGVTVLASVKCRGLAPSRNRVMKECRTRHVLFIDDDVHATKVAIEKARSALSRGADVIGARITADLQGRRAPWYLTTGQLHYLGAHDPAGPAPLWGAFLGIDVERARLLGIEFDEGLGRTERTLCSGEDTTFVRELVARGGRQEILQDAHVLHRIPASRLQLAYLLRRAFWQGRSEYRRRDARRGLGKEWSRNWRSSCCIPRRVALTVTFGCSVTAGVACEAVSAVRTRLARAAARFLDTHFQADGRRSRRGGEGYDAR